MVLPILTFGTELWGYEYADTIENVHFSFCRKFLGVDHSVSSYLYVVGYPYVLLFNIKVVKYWCKLNYVWIIIGFLSSVIRCLWHTYADLGRIKWVTQVNQSVENAGVAFVKGAHERN